MKSFSSNDQRRIEKIIRVAGKRLIEYVNINPLLQKYEKDISSVVTQADIDTEEFLKKELNKYFPQIGFYSEETYKKAEPELEKEYCWVVDPVDGTLNFSRKVPIFGVSIGLLYKKKPIFGSIYLPYLREYFFALKDSGSYLNGKRISVRKSNNDRDIFGACEVGLSVDKYKRFIEIRSQKYFDSVHPYCTVYCYSHCAAGQYDFALSVKAALWDIAAAWILIEEAGGVFSIFHNDSKLHPEQSPYDLCCIAGSKPVVDRLTQDFKILVTTP